MFIWICPNNADHYYAAPDWSPDNADIYRPQIHNTPDGTREGPPRVTCPYCKTLGVEVARVCHQVDPTALVRRVRVES